MKKNQVTVLVSVLHFWYSKVGFGLVKFTVVDAMSSTHSLTERCGYMLL